MSNFTVDVTVSTHDDVKDGVLAQKIKGGQFSWHRILVSADSDLDALLVASQMASLHGMCTSAVLCV